MILCDTNILIELLKGNPEVAAELQKIQQHNLAVSVITVAELYFGALNKAEFAMIKRELALLSQLSIDEKISNTFVRLMGTYSLSHRPSLPDTLIAATALVHDIELYTFNQKDFRYISKLKLYQQTSG